MVAEPKHVSHSPSDEPLSRGMSRRGFMKAVGVSAGLMVAWSSTRVSGHGSPGHGIPAARTQFGGPSAPMDLDSYLLVNDDGSVTLMTGKVEFGQGIQTGFGQLVAEELSLPFESVEVLCGTRTDLVPYDTPTVGSMSTRFTGPRLRQAAAEMREWLIELGSEELGVEAEKLDVQDGSVVVVDEPETSVAFSALASGKLAARELREDVVLKDPADYTVVGQSIPRVDVPSKVDGSAIFGIDASIEGMVYGKVLRAPARGSTLESVDFSAAEGMPGVVGVLHDGNFAGIAAESLEQAEAAIAAVQAEWTLPATTTTHETIFELLRSTGDEGQVLEEEGTTPEDPAAGLETAAHTISVSFTAPYVSHAPMEPKTALVSIDGDKIDVWTPTQSPFNVQSAVADALGVPPEQVVAHSVASGGAFGSKGTDAEVEAARLAQAVGRPVKIIWTRQEEYQNGRFRPAMAIDIEAGVGESGSVDAWNYTLYSSAYYPEGAENPTACAANASANIRSVYDVPTSITTWFQSDSPFPPHFWRGNGAAVNTFAREVTLDELAELAGLDPVTFRGELLLNNPRMQAVLDAVVEKAGWTPGVGSTGEGVGVALTFENGSYCGAVAHVDVDESSGEIHVRHVDTSIDCGLVVNPLAVRNQAEGSVIQSLSPTLREMVRFENGRVTNPSFGGARPITMMESPTVDVVFVEDKTQPMGGVGEPFVAPIPAAVSNAVYDAVGIRLRDLPFTPDRVLAALAERDG